MFKRPHHQRIACLLESLDHEIIRDTQCFFGGGTAAALLLGEYRESVDVDFLCSSAEGYRKLRNILFENGLEHLFRKPVAFLRDVRTDRYGIRTVINVDGHPVRFEIVREGNLRLIDDGTKVLGVPTLSRDDLFATKLLANDDRGLDTSNWDKDIIDLAMMISAWGPISTSAWEKARLAYGHGVESSFVRASERICRHEWLMECMSNMGMDATLVSTIRDALNCVPDQETN